MRRAVGRAFYVIAALLLVASACGGADDDSEGDTSSVSTVGNVSGLSATCESLANLSIAMTSMFSASPDEIERLLDGVTDVPSVVAEDVELLEGAIRELATAWAEFGGNPLADPTAVTEMSAADRERMEEVMDRFSDDATNNAFDRVSEYTEQECVGIGPSG